MGLRSALIALARDAPVPVFAIAGRGARASIQRLRLDDRLTLVDTPRHATVLLIVGLMPEALNDPARRVHDMLPHPRATVAWELGRGDDASANLFEHAVTISEGSATDAVDTVVAIGRELRAGARPTESDVLPDIDPAPWRDVGPYGQGGKGMTGGVPYGRPMAGRAPDRDLLELDQLPLRIGPFFPPLPPGLVLDLLVQGDVVQAATIPQNPFSPADGSTASPDETDIFRAALSRPVRLADIELARAGHHLRWAAEALRVAGLASVGLRVLAVAEALRPEHAPEVRTIARRLDRDIGLRLSHRGVGVADLHTMERLGPVARAAGLDHDARTDDPLYERLGFEPVTQREGDVHARWRQRWAEAAQALDVAGRANEVVWAGDVIEALRGPINASTASSTAAANPAARLLEVAAAVIVGQEWGDAIATMVSLDLDVEEAARPAAPGRPGKPGGPVVGLSRPSGADVGVDAPGSVSMP